MVNLGSDKPYKVQNRLSGGIIPGPNTFFFLWSKDKFPRVIYPQHRQLNIECLGGTGFLQLVREGRKPIDG